MRKGTKENQFQTPPKKKKKEKENSQSQCERTGLPKNLYSATRNGNMGRDEYVRVGGCADGGDKLRIDSCGSGPG